MLALALDILNCCKTRLGTKKNLTLILPGPILFDALVFVSQPVRTAYLCERTPVPATLIHRRRARGVDHIGLRVAIRPERIYCVYWHALRNRYIRPSVCLRVAILKPIGPRVLSRMNRSHRQRPSILVPLRVEPLAVVPTVSWTMIYPDYVSAASSGPLNLGRLNSAPRKFPEALTASAFSHLKT